MEFKQEKMKGPTKLKKKDIHKHNFILDVKIKYPFKN